MVGLIRISLTLTWFGDSTAYTIALAMSSACNDSIFLALSTNVCNDSSVIVFISSVATTPGSIHVTRIFFLTLSSCLNPSLKAVIACFVAQYTLPAGKTILPATYEILII